MEIIEIVNKYFYGINLTGATKKEKDKTEN